jgi:hypothetical protein
MTDSYIRRAQSLDAGADACLEALRAVLSYRAAHWTKYELAAWLAGPYRHAACPHTKASTGGAPPESTPTSEDPVDGERLRDILQSARHRVRAVLRDPARTFYTEAEALLASGRVVQLRSESGSWFVPVNHRRMRLEERILSLAVAYYLMRPAELAAVDLSPRFPQQGHAEGLRRTRGAS